MSALPGTTGRRRIYLMRHGHVDYFAREVREAGHTDLVPLTPLGREQAKASGAALSHVRFDLALSSGLPRTRETAEIVLAANADTAHLTLGVDAGLVEIKGSGKVMAKSREELAARMAFEFDQAAEPGARMMGGDVFADVQERATDAIKRLLAQPAWHTALVVAHEGVNRLVLSWMTGNALKGVQAFEQDLACINILDFDLVPREDGSVGTQIARSMIKAVNITPYNFVKHGMNLTSLEAIFARV
ncbi:MAG: histidine phosphatase family protein [Alphaproteobacteria bacterium]|jgi:probable phosphoglycerate mutase|nr:histidine phosphatase family protein [Alphaproteobacteria bacterium]